MMKVIITNTKTNEELTFNSLTLAKEYAIPESAKTGYTFKVRHALTNEEIGNIRPNHQPHKTASNPKRKMTARFIRHD